MFPVTETVNHLALVLSSGFLGFAVAFVLAKPFIANLVKFKIGKSIREMASSGEEAKLFRSLHLKKEGVPTMGGILIWGSALIVMLLTRIFSYIGLIDHSLINRKETYLPLFTLITVALLGAIDDYLNISGWTKKGMSVKLKFFWLTVLGIMGGLWFYYKLGYDQIHVPGVNDFFIGWWYIPLFVFIFVGSANAVNFTDGLDGLAGGLLTISFLAFSALAYAHGLLILAAFCAVIAGATVAFLWFNIPPARFIMGDTGALSLGATLGVIALMTDTVLILPFIGGIFVIETLTVIAQIFSKKVFGKKIWHIAPIHHHFEYIGWPESQVVMRFWILGALFAAFGLILGLVGMGI